MSVIKIDGGYFCDDPHRYWNDEEKIVPSITQVLKSQGFIDFSGINEEVLANAARRGTEVHALAAAWNKNNDIDPTWISDECRPYFNAYLQFLKESMFVPDPEWSERPLIASIYGLPYAVTPDIFGRRGRDKVLIEFKCTSTSQDYWSIQTCAQECAIFKSNRCGRVRRYVLMLRKDGTYRLSDEHTNHEDDLANFIGALRNCHWRLSHGQKLWEGEAA